MGKNGGASLALALALDQLGGRVIVLDADLRVAAASAGARDLLGIEIPGGALAANLLCGRGPRRPIADALAEGRPGRALLVWPDPSGVDRTIAIDATPIDGAGAADDRGGRPRGYILELSEPATAGTPSDEDAPGAVEYHGLWTGHPAMKALFATVERAAASDATVLVRGETGTGKEHIAAAIHQRSRRRDGPYRAINCASLAPTLLESELFGHVRGAFTGALRDNPGHLRLAEGGTIFLDEVAEIPLELQAKLLRVLETHTVIPVGGTDPISIDARIVSATHRSLRDEVDAGRFRADLMYRLRVVPLFLPPLRERGEDVLLLAERFIASFNTRGGRAVTRIGPDAREAMLGYAWPGNVRELINALEYAYVIGAGPTLRATELPPELTGPRRPLSAPPVNAPSSTAPRDGAAPTPEIARIRRALDRASGNRDRAAKLLGVSRVTLWRRMKALGLS